MAQDPAAIDRDAAEPVRRMGWPRTFEALGASGEYRRYFLGHGVSLVGTWMQQAAVLWLVLEITGSEAWLGAMDAAGVLPGLFVGLVAGAMADRVPPRRMVLSMLIAQALLALLLAWLVDARLARLWHMGAILALTRVCVTFELPSRQVLVFDIVGRRHLMNAIALNSGLFNASRMLGPAVAGLVLAHWSAAACFAINGLSYLAAIASTLSLKPRFRPKDTGAESHGSKALLAGLAYVHRDGRVRTLYILMFGFGVVGMGYSALLPAYARKIIGTGPIGYSMLLAATGLGATCGALLVATVAGTKRRESIVLGGMVVFGLGLAGASVFPGLLGHLGIPDARLPVAMLCVLIAGFGGILFYSSTQTLIQLAVPDHLRGRIIGIWMIAFSGSVPLGSLWAGYAAHSVGVTKVLFFSAAVIELMAFGVKLSGSLRHEPAA